MIYPVNDDRAVLIQGDSREVLATFEDASIDAVVCDPPYELGFMGKAWDATGIAYDARLWGEVLRVLKPGGHLIAFGGTRTYHRMTVAIEDVGFEIRDSLHWIYGTGFPKSLDVSKAVDASLGVERRKCSSTPMMTGSDVGSISRNLRCSVCGKPRQSADPCRCPRDSGPGSPEAAQWHGWGTALKPAHEPAVLARKPLIGTVAANVLEHGTGALNIDACRIGDEGGGGVGAAMTGFHGSGAYQPKVEPGSIGRWPANLLFDEQATNDISEAQRAFFYVAKPSRRERDFGCESLPAASAGEATDREDGTDGLRSPRAGAGRTGGARNTHPTVKPVELMRYLIRLVTPPGGVVLDPFAGSGTTGLAAIAEGVPFIGVELDEGHCRIAKARLDKCLSEGWK